MYLSLPLYFLSLKKYVSMNELRGATTPQVRIGLLTKGSSLLSPTLSLLNPSEMLAMQKGEFSECPIVK